jgi:hypothetical protein
MNSTDIFLSPKSPDQRRPTQPHMQYRGSFPVEKAAAALSEPLTSTRADVKNGCIYVSAPPVCLCGAQRPTLPS